MIFFVIDRPFRERSFLREVKKKYGNKSSIIYGFRSALYLYIKINRLRNFIWIDKAAPYYLEDKLKKISPYGYLILNDSESLSPWDNSEFLKRRYPKNTTSYFDEIWTPDKIIHQKVSNWISEKKIRNIGHKYGGDFLLKPLNKNKKLTILFLSSFGILTKDRNWIFDLNNEVGDKSQNEIYKNHLKALHKNKELFFKAFKSLISNPDYKLIFRFHPTEFYVYNEKEKNILKKHTTNNSYEKDLEVSDIVINPGSTVNYECPKFNCRSLVIQTKDSNTLIKSAEYANVFLKVEKDIKDEHLSKKLINTIEQVRNSEYRINSLKKINLPDLKNLFFLPKKTFSIQIVNFLFFFNFLISRTLSIFFSKKKVYNKILKSKIKSFNIAFNTKSVIVHENIN